MKNKKAGGMIPNWLLGVFILVLSFVIILIVIGVIDWKKTADIEACHQSALLRASTPNLAKKKILDLPLRCQTEKICISTSIFSKIPFVGGCKKFKGEKNIRIEYVSSEDEIKQIIADAMYDCWWQFYFAENNLFSRDSFNDVNICALCSRIAFDNSAKRKYNEIRGITDFLKKTKIKNSDKTYYQYFFSGIGNLQEKDTKEEVPIDTSEEYVIAYDIFERSSLDYVLPSGAGCAASALLGLKIGGVITAVPVIGWVVGPVTGAGIFATGCILSDQAGKEIDNAITGEKFAVGMNLREYSGEDLKYCDNIVTLP